MDFDLALSNDLLSMPLYLGKFLTRRRIIQAETPTFLYSQNNSKFSFKASQTSSLQEKINLFSYSSLDLLNAKNVYIKCL